MDIKICLKGLCMIENWTIQKKWQTFKHDEYRHAFRAFSGGRETSHTLKSQTFKYILRKFYI
jgi:hypothetical protein